MARQGLKVTRPDSDSPVHARVYICVCTMAYRVGADGDSGHLSSVCSRGATAQDVCVHMQVGLQVYVCVQCGAAS